MGFMSSFLGSQENRTAADYVELDLDDFESATDTTGAAMNVHVAEVADQQDALEIKDVVYDGGLVIADITRLRTSDRTVQHVVDELRQVADEVDGDIVQKGDDQIIVAPTGVRISRDKIGRGR
ncbi:hypothetical protein BRD17_08135 [Halobacteriales archaeon SW_7_68_16]|nr:MAG: hypothetical protein BRD17_08135 [Halobacteriales archaeon SW_7_68_16]